MAQYSRTVLTDAGVILARRMMDETITMEFTRIVTGDGQYSSGEDIAARTALKSQKQSFPLSSRSLTDEDRVLHLKYVISNVNPDSSPLTVGYYVREVGIYAHVTGESEILYAVAIADADTADYMPEYDELQPATITMDWFITVGNTENITIQASPSAYALAEDLEELAEVVDQKLDADGDSKNNTVSFTSSDAADSDVTKSTGWDTVAPLTSGETHESFMTKFSNMIKNLRWIYKLLGTTDISAIGNGTVTGGLSSLNSSLAKQGFKYHHDVSLRSILSANVDNTGIPYIFTGYNLSDWLSAGFCFGIVYRNVSVSSAYRIITISPLGETNEAMIATAIYVYASNTYSNRAKFILPWAT